MIAIKSMKNIPMSCSVCGLKSGSYCYHKKPPYDLNGINVLKERASDCPLVEIITCKNCKHKAYETKIKGDESIKIFCRKNKTYRCIDGFCSDGERRE